MVTLHARFEPPACCAPRAAVGACSLLQPRSACPRATAPSTHPATTSCRPCLPRLVVGVVQQEDDEGGGMEEPPEVSDFIRELSGQEAGSPLGGASAGGTGMQAPRCALGRVAGCATGGVGGVGG